MMLIVVISLIQLRTNDRPKLFMPQRLNDCLGMGMGIDCMGMGGNEM